MKHFVLLALVALAPFAQADYFGSPQIVIGETNHRLVDSNDMTGENYQSAKGYCVALGYDYASGSESRTYVDGPYAVLNAAAELVTVFPVSEENKRGLSVLTGVYCANF